MPRWTASDVGYALLLSVPVGLGVTLAALKVTGGDYSNPLVVGFGAAVALVIFLVVTAGFATGEEDPERGR